MIGIISKRNVLITLIYTIGHFIIALVCNKMITGANIELATLDAIIEPMINGVWFYTLNHFFSFK